MGDHRHRSAIVDENRRLRAALSAIHDLLHRDQVDEAHRAVECAMGGEYVSQPSLSADDSADSHTLAEGFNALLKKHGATAAMLAAFPVKDGAPGQMSLQLSGNVELCRMVETAMRGSSSVYAGDKEAANG